MTKSHTYGQILKSSALIGGSSILSIIIRIFSTKAMAMILGPSGVGLLSLYRSITELTISIAGMGINNSGVRQIAEAVGSSDTEKIAQTAAVLRRISFFLGVLGAVFLAVFSKPVSILTFGSDHHATAVALLSIVVFFNLVAAGQGALIQGMRRISDMAKMGILSTFFGSVISIILVYFLREEGLVPSLILIAAMTILMAWWYSRKIYSQRLSIPVSQFGQEAAALLKLGFAFMAIALLNSGAEYTVRIVVVSKVGFDAAGLYQSAWALSGLYIGIILQSILTDFYPRLTAIAHDNTECNRIVNEQTHVGLLLAGPGVIATLTFAPLIIALFYTPKFEGAVEVLRWLCLGMTFRVISWPMGFIMVAKKNLQTLFILSELAWISVYLGLVWVCVSTFNLKGAGIAFFASYIFHLLMTYIIARRLSGFRWSTANIETILRFSALIAFVFCSYYALPPLLAMGGGTLAVLLSGIYSIQVLLNLVPRDRMPRPVLKLLQGFHLLSPSSSYENNDLDPMVKKIIGGRALENKPMANINRLIFGCIICTVFFMWIHWYEGVYGWLTGQESFESRCNTLLLIFKKR